ncbi:MAG: PAS domain-containing sensor histidine kinase, partial [Bdellovibrionota bacterium]
TDKFPLKENDGKVIGVLGIARMTTDLVKVKTELHKMDQQVHSLQKSMDASAIVAVTDIKGKILEVNDNFCRISKYGREELMGKDHRILNSGFHGKEFFADMWNTILSGRPWSGEVRNRAKDGTFYWVFTTITPEHDDNGAIDRFVSIRFEITKQKHFEEDLEKQRLYLVHSEKMSSIGEVCAGLAHEINNPLTIIAGNIDKLQEELGNPAVERDAMKLRTEKIAKMVSRINKIIKALRSIARDGAGDPFERTSLRSVLDETLDLCGERFRNYGVKVEVDCPADVFCDCRGVQISQVLLNLLINAYDAIQNLPERWIKVKISAEGEDAVVCVVDSGKGLSPEIIQKLMRPFFTTKPQGKGVGLGLSISKGIVEQHHGRLAYCGKGPNTCFQFRLPLKQKT